MTNLYTIIGRINQRLSIKQNLSKDIAFPERIGKYKLEKILRFDVSLSGYAFARYRNGKRSAIAKAYFGSSKNHLFYGLQNEITTYVSLRQKNKVSVKINNRYFNIPRVIDTAIDENKLILLLEEISNTTKIKTREYLHIYEDVITYIEGLKVTRSLKKKVNSISPYYMLATSPFILFFALLHRPKLKSLLLNSYTYFIKNWIVTNKYRWNTLVHRDLRASILIAKNKVFVIDWQLASISNELLEYAQLFVTYLENKRMGINFDGFKRIKNLTTEEKILFKVITIHVLLTEIGFVKTKKLIDEKILLEKIIAL